LLDDGEHPLNKINICLHIKEAKAIFQRVKYNEAFFTCRPEVLVQMV
jgi:hypothetical protein